MALNNRNQETEKLASDLAALTGETKTEAVTKALRERLALQGGGFHKDRLRLTPRLPKHWPTCKISYRYRETIYQIAISRVANGASGGDQIILDGEEVADGVIPLVDDQREHLLDMRLR